MNPVTPLPIIAIVSRIVTKVADRIAGDRSDYPLLVAVAGQEALNLFQIESRVMYGPSAWIEILEDQSPIWAGCWGENFNFWIATQFGEIVDLNSSVGHRKRAHRQLNTSESQLAHDTPNPLRSIYSPPLLWSAEVPAFYRYKPDGIAELELTDPQDIRRFRAVVDEVKEKCALFVNTVTSISEDELEFPNESILCPGRKLLDDSNQSFKHFDRALSIHGLPPAPF